MMMKKTGFNYLDNLSDEERKEALANFKLFQSTLTDEQRAEHHKTAMDTVAKIRKEQPLLTANLSDVDIMRAYLNGVDLDAIKQGIIEIFEKNGYHEYANDLRRRRLLIDTFEIKFFDEETGKEMT